MDRDSELCTKAPPGNRERRDAANLEPEGIRLVERRMPESHFPGRLDDLPSDPGQAFAGALQRPDLARAQPWRRRRKTDSRQTEKRLSRTPRPRSCEKPSSSKSRMAGNVGSTQSRSRSPSKSRASALATSSLFWGSFQPVDDELRKLGRPEHHVWGWLQVGDVAPVDDVVRSGGSEWRWAQAHPHLAFPPDPTNTLYVANKALSLPGVDVGAIRGFGVFEFASDKRRLTAQGAKNASEWSLPSGFLPSGRPPLTYHGSLDRWTLKGQRAHLSVVAKRARVRPRPCGLPRVNSVARGDYRGRVGLKETSARFPSATLSNPERARWARGPLPLSKCAPRSNTRPLRPRYRPEPLSSSGDSPLAPTR